MESWPKPPLAPGNELGVEAAGDAQLDRRALLLQLKLDRREARRVMCLS